MEVSCDLLRNLMSRVFNVAKTWNLYAGENPASGVMLPEKRPVREKHVLDHAQIQPLLDALREPCRTMVLLGLLTGMRIGEILGLRWQDVDLMACQLRIRQTICRGAVNTPKTKGSWRLLPLPRVVVRALVIMRPDSRQIKDTTLVFSTAQTTPLGDTKLLHRH